MGNVTHAAVLAELAHLLNELGEDGEKWCVGTNEAPIYEYGLPDDEWGRGDVTGYQHCLFGALAVVEAMPLRRFSTRKDEETTEELCANELTLTPVGDSTRDVLTEACRLLFGSAIRSQQGPKQWSAPGISPNQVQSWQDRSTWPEVKAVIRKAIEMTEGRV